MSDAYPCAICGELSSSTGCFLVAESRWQDKLTIFGWHDELAARPGIHHACGVSHVQELVVHWMATGQLDYPLARTPHRNPPAVRWKVRCEPALAIEPERYEVLGELSVDRESIHRILSENPHSLKAILDGLQGSLQGERVDEAAEFERPAGRVPSTNWEA